MHKYLVYLLFIIAFTTTTSCSKEETEPEQITSEAKIANETGISFTNASGFDADYLVFQLKSGSSKGQEYGQSLKGYNYTELQAGAKTIFQMNVFKEGKQLSFSAYSKDGEGNRTAIKSTSVVVIKEKQVLEIVLEKPE